MPRHNVIMTATLFNIYAKGFIRRRKTRLAMMDILLGNWIGKITSTNDLDDKTLQELLDRFFPGWETPGIPFPNQNQELQDLAFVANEEIIKLFGFPPPNTPNPNGKKERNRRTRNKYKARLAKRIAERKAAKQTKTQPIPQIDIPKHEPITNDRLAKLNAWRKKAGLPPVEKV